MKFTSNIRPDRWLMIDGKELQTIELNDGEEEIYGLATKEPVILDSRIEKYGIKVDITLWEWDSKEIRRKFIENAIDKDGIEIDGNRYYLRLLDAKPSQNGYSWTYSFLSYDLFN